MRKEDKMISVEEAESIMAKFGKPKGIEEVSLLSSLGRVLGEEVYSEIEMPPFDKSAMDGYALISSDGSERFEIIETIPAGKFPEKEIKPGQCAKIMTGAPLPPGADRVVKVEVTEEKNGFMYLTDEDKGFNVCIRGEDIKKGDKILEKGTVMRAPEVGAIASLGFDRIKVYKKVVAAVITTGSEIVEPGNKLMKGNIYNSNGYSISSQLINSGAKVLPSEIVGDDKKKIKEVISEKIDKSDLLIISGGVSMGEFDFVPEILEGLGMKIHFNKVAIQPGKPTLFATKGSKIVFGLPGNPVSTFVIFEIMVKPVLARMSGTVLNPVSHEVKIKNDFKRRKTERDLYVPAFIDDKGFVDVVDYHGSAHFVSLTKANCLLKVKRGIKIITGGSKVNVRQI